MAKYVIINSIVNGSYQNCVNANGYVKFYINNSKYSRFTCAYIGTGTVYGIRLSPSLANSITPTSSTRVYHYFVLIIADKQYKISPYAYYNDDTSGIGGGDQSGGVIINGRTYSAGDMGFQLSINESSTIVEVTGVFTELTDTVNTEDELYSLLVSLGIYPLSGEYPITYSSSNSTVSGPSSAAVGDTVIVSAVPDVGYGITDASTQILVTNNDVAVPYTWDVANNRITFTMPDPS